MLTALAIAGIVAAAVVAGVDALVRWTSEARSQARRANRAGAVRDQISVWLAGAATPGELASGSFDFRDGTSGSAPADELAWTTLAPSPFNDGQTRVRLFVDRDSTTERRGLVADLSGPGELSTRRVELAPAVTGLDVRFRLASGGHGWSSGWTSTSQLPAAVELTVSGESLNAVLRAPIVVTWSRP